VYGRRRKHIMYLFFDTETTGLPKDYAAPITDSDNWPRLVQLAFLLYDISGNKKAEGDFIVKPDGFEIPDEASKIHGITTEKAISDGVEIGKVLNVFASFANVSTCFVAHNFGFDKKIVGAEFCRFGMEDIIADKNKICTMLTSTKHCEIPGSRGFKWPKLQELHVKLFGAQFEEAHNAFSDIKATAKCFWELKRLGIIKE